jgi:hypothetical protein
MFKCLSEVTKYLKNLPVVGMETLPPICIGVRATGKFYWQKFKNIYIIRTKYR